MQIRSAHLPHARSGGIPVLWGVPEDADVPKSPSQHRAGLWTPKNLVGNEQQHLCGVKASLNNTMVCKAVPALLSGRE